MAEFNSDFLFFENDELILNTTATAQYNLLLRFESSDGRQVHLPYYCYVCNYALPENITPLTLEYHVAFFDIE